MKINDLKAELSRKGLTQQRFAELMGLAPKTLYNKFYAKNKRGSFTDKEIERIGEILELENPMEFFKGGDS